MFKQISVLLLITLISGCSTISDKQDPSVVHNSCYSYMYGVNGFPLDYKKALGWCSQGAEMGIPSSQTLLAEIYAYGHGLDQDLELAGKYYLQAANQNHLHAQLMVFQLFNVIQAESSSSEQKKVGIEFLKKAADSGYEQAIKLREKIYGSGDINANEQFERLYLALGLEEIISSFGPVEFMNEEVIVRSFAHLPQDVQDALKDAIEQKIILNTPPNHTAAKDVFRKVIMGLLTAEELAIVADFYSSEVGLKIHHSIIDGENAVSEYFNNGVPHKK